MRALVLTLLFTVSAHATVGGDHHLEVLGYEPVDGKLYVLVHRGGEVGGPPRLHFLPLLGDDPHRLRPVRSWHVGADVEAGFPVRLKALRARLTPTPAADLAGAALTVTRQDLRVCADARRQPRTGAEARALVARWQAGDPDLDSPVCRLLRLDVRWSGFAGTTWAEAWGGATLLSVRPLPDPRFALAVVRYVGQHFESGYAVERPVLLRSAAPVDLAATPQAHGRCHDVRPAPPPEVAVPGLAPGTWRPRLTPDAVAPGGWLNATHHRREIGGVIHTALVAHGADWARLALARAAPGGGVCVLALHRDDFGGNGVAITPAELARRGDEAVWVFRASRRPRGGAPEVAWLGIHLRGDAARVLPESAARPRVRWTREGPRWAPPPRGR